MNQNTDQLALFAASADVGDDLPPCAADSETSAAAAESIVPSRSRLKEMVYDAVAAAGARGMTCDEVEVALDMRHQTASARVYDLRKDGRLVDSGVRRKTRSGRFADVWLTDAWESTKAL